MPGTVQELASTFREAIDSQGNVRDMGVVQEVVLALERSPVSASDLKDLKSTRLGKYINQVRRNISDKTLAKRMKRLVIQWRSLAQKAPSTPNGVPSGSPPSFAVPTSSPPSSVTTTSSTPAQNSPPQPPVATPLSDLSTLSPHPPSSSPALPPPSRPPSKNPPSHRKKLLHALSKVKSHPSTSHTPLKSASQLPPVSTSSSTQLHSSPSPPLMNSSQNHSVTRVPSPPPPPLSANSVSLAHSTPPSSASLPSPPPLSSTSSLAASPAGIVEAAVPSLPVSLPLNSVVQGLVVKIPLGHVTPSKTLGETQAADTAPIAGQTEKEGEKERDRKVRRRKTRALIVSVSRLLLDRHLHSSPAIPPESSTTGGDSTLPAQEEAQDSPQQLRDLPPHSTSPQKSTLSPPSQSPGQVCVPNGHCPGIHGCYGSDGLWYSWTEPILGQDFAVNVLPYVYIDGLDELCEA